MLKIENTPKAKKELEHFRNNIKKLSGTAKIEAEKIYAELIKVLDSMNKEHSSEYNGFIKPNRISNNIEISVKLRSKLYQILKNN